MEFIYYNEKITESERQDQKLPPIYSKQEMLKVQSKKAYLGHFHTSTRQYDRQNGKFNIDKKKAIILIGMRIYPMAYFCVQLRAVDSYLNLSVLHMWAISGTRGSSGFGSVSKEHIESKTCMQYYYISITSYVNGSRNFKSRRAEGS